MKDYALLKNYRTKRCQELTPVPKTDIGTSTEISSWFSIYIQEQVVLKTGTENRPTVINYAIYVCVWARTVTYGEVLRVHTSWQVVVYSRSELLEGSGLFTTLGWPHLPGEF